MLEFNFWRKSRVQIRKFEGQSVSFGTEEMLAEGYLMFDKRIYTLDLLMKL